MEDTPFQVPLFPALNPLRHPHPKRQALKIPLHNLHQRLQPRLPRLGPVPRVLHLRHVQARDVAAVVPRQPARGAAVPGAEIENAGGGREEGAEEGGHAGDGAVGGEGEGVVGCEVGADVDVGAAPEGVVEGVGGGGVVVFSRCGGGEGGCWDGSERGCGRVAGDVGRGIHGCDGRGSGIPRSWIRASLERG